MGVDGVSVSVVIPSALKQAPGGELWLTHALRSVAAQTVRPCEVIVGIDPGERIPGDAIPAGSHDVRRVNAPQKGHQSATNAAAAQAKGEWIAMLEDDDLWEPDHLETLLAVAKEHGADFVSASQVQVTTGGAIFHTAGNPVVLSQHAGAFHFPTASSWLVLRELWDSWGGFDDRFRIHHDNEFLGRIRWTEKTYSRVHVVPEDTPPHPWLDNVARHAKVVRWPGLTHYTVRRTVHEGSVLAGCRQDQAKAERSAKEYAALEILYGCVPW